MLNKTDCKGTLSTAAVQQKKRAYLSVVWKINIPENKQMNAYSISGDQFSNEATITPSCLLHAYQTMHISGIIIIKKIR